MHLHIDMTLCFQDGSYANPLGCGECELGVTTMVSSAVRKEVKMSVANVTGDPTDIHSDAFNVARIQVRPGWLTI